MNLYNLLTCFLELLYPNTCLGCQELLKSRKNCICIACQFSLPKSKIIDLSNNVVHKKFWGRIPLLQAYSLYRFQRNGVLQILLHQFKYQGKDYLGEFLGKQLAISLQNNHEFIYPDVVIPVPLHKKKERKRGYNQSLIIAKKMSQIWKIPIMDNAITRVSYSSTQTKKRRYERWENVNTIFELNEKKKEEIKNKHILIIDDIVTTGATLEACVKEILKSENVKISIATIAYA